jgi:hypothetical protein
MPEKLGMACDVPAWSDGMSVRPVRLVVVRRGETALFESLEKQFATDPETRVIWDRRLVDRRHGERRFPDGMTALRDRGFFVTRAVGPGFWEKPGDHPPP